MKRIVALLKTAFQEFSEDRAAVLAAALAFYGILAVAPVLLLVVAASSFLGVDAQDGFLEQLREATGPEAADAVAAIMKNTAQRQGTGIIATIIAFGAMLFATANIAGQLRASLNQIWDVEATPPSIWSMVLKRVGSLALLLLIGVLMAISLSVTTALQSLLSDAGAIWQVLSVLLDVVIFTGLFALVYRYLPDVKISWRDVGVGALVTALFFILGKFGISIYLARSGVASAYGAAGSLIVILLWIYYSFLILFFGAEITQAYAAEYGRELAPEEHARRLTDVPSPEPT